MRLLLPVLATMSLLSGCCGLRDAEPAPAPAPAPAVATDPLVLPAGTYRCTVTGSTPPAIQEVVVERVGDRVVATPKSGRQLSGFLFGTRLALVSATVSELGIEVLQIQANQQPDGTFAGTVERLRDGALTDRREVVISALPQ